MGTGPGLKGVWDRALLLLGFCRAFRRSEFVALDIEGIEECDPRLRVTVGYGKTDQKGEGAIIGIVRDSIACPIQGLRVWRQAVGITAGPLFRSISKGGKIGERLRAWPIS